MMNNKKFQVSTEKLEEITLSSLINKILMLYLIKKANEIYPLLYGRIKFQKMFFLSELMLEQERIQGLTFRYFRYNNGPFSKDLFATFENLETHGLTKGTSSKRFKLTKEGEYLFETIKSSGLYKSNIEVIRFIDETIKKYGNKVGTDLMNIVYGIKVPLWNLNTHSVTYKKIKSIDTYTDLLPFDFIKYKKKFSIPDDLIEDLLYEFSLTPEDKSDLRKISSKTTEELFAL